MRQTSDRHKSDIRRQIASSLNAPPNRGGGIRMHTFILYMDITNHRPLLLMLVELAIVLFTTSVFQLELFRMPQ